MTSSNLTPRYMLDYMYSPAPPPKKNYVNQFLLLPLWTDEETETEGWSRIRSDLSFQVLQEADASKDDGAEEQELGGGGAFRLRCSSDIFKGEGEGRRMRGRAQTDHRAALSKPQLGR